MNLGLSQPSKQGQLEFKFRSQYTPGLNNKGIQENKKAIQRTPKNCNKVLPVLPLATQYTTS